MIYVIAQIISQILIARALNSFGQEENKGQLDAFKGRYFVGDKIMVQQCGVVSQGKEDRVILVTWADRLEFC